MLDYKLENLEISYNPDIIEPLPNQFNEENFGDYYPNEYEAYKFNPDFWLNHITPITTGEEPNLPHQYTNFSGFGNKCKVEIISRTDLLRARGFKV